MENNISMFKGDLFGRALTFTKKSDGTAIDITGWTIFFTVKKNLSDADSDALLSKDITVHTDPTEGISELTIAPGDTRAIVAGTYFYDMQYKTLDGSIKTFITGMITIKDDVTIRASI